MRRHKHDYRHRIEIQRVQDGEPVQFGHLNIEKDKIRRLLLNGSHRLPPVRAFANQFKFRLLRQ